MHFLNATKSHPAHKEQAAINISEFHRDASQRCNIEEELTTLTSLTGVTLMRLFLSSQTTIDKQSLNLIVINSVG
jgi:hypothetical protein